jgi:replication factor A1
MRDEFIKVGDLSPKSKGINLVFKVVEVEEIRNVRSKKDRTPHAVTEAFVGDETGMVLMTVWDEMLEKIRLGGVYELTNGYVSLFRGSIRLNIGKYGGLSEIESPDFEVNKNRNLSEEKFNDPRRRSPRDMYGSGSFWPG